MTLKPRLVNSAMGLPTVVAAANSAAVLLSLVVLAGLAMSTVVGQDIARLVEDSDWELSEQYERGPSRWSFIWNASSELPLWPICREGQQQSPADMRQTRTTQGLRRIVNTWVDSNNFSISNDGVRIRVAPEDVEPSFVDPVTRRSSTLRYIQFHIPSGHRAGGTNADLELSLVHGGSRYDSSEPPDAILSVQFDATFADNAVLSNLIDSIPNPPARDDETGTTLPPRTVVVRRPLLIDALLPPVLRDYVTYTGSEVQPPCREGVTHYVFSQRMSMSYAQLAAIRSKLHITTALNAGWTPRSARASRPPVVDGRWAPTLHQYIVPREQYHVDTPPEFEAVSVDTILALVALCASGIVCVLAMAAFVIAMCYPRVQS